ncbi:hypothetical protein DO72_3388 [Burkholderia pseudomallei]|nr:hypothetical protein DO72_3388 [Burkholderia pseudomallei]
MAGRASKRPAMSRHIASRRLPAPAARAAGTFAPFSA